MTEPDKPRAPAGQSLGSVFRSVAASMFGVQSSRKHEEDFGHGKASTYIVAGAVATLIFVLALWGLVRLVVGIAASGPG